MLAVAGTGVVAAGWWLAQNAFLVRYVIETRRFMLALKTRGHVPDVGMLALSRRMGPRWMQAGEPAFVSRGSASGDGPCDVPWHTPLGTFHGSAADGAVLDHLIIEELGGHIYDREPAALRTGDVVLDVGAHLGTFTRYALMRGASRVIAIEPMPDLAGCLARTFRDEVASGSVVIAEVAAWNEDGELSFATGPQSTMGHVGSGEVVVASERIDALVARIGIERVDFIKMDIEGAEPEALAGAVGLIRRDRPRMAICIYHDPDHAESIPRAILEAAPGYHTFTRGPFQAYFH